MAKTKSSQDFVEIKEIKDGIIILKSGGMRTVLMTSSLNFALKSNDEQSAIINQYQNFLNSLDFSVQIFVQSRPVNINPYLDVLKEAEKTQTSELVKIQTKEYIDFIKTLVETTNIMTKNFYVVVPFSPSVLKISESKGGIISKIKTAVGYGSKTKEEDEKSESLFLEYQEQLLQRTDVVIGELIRLGVRAVPLNTEEIIELFYYLYNPGEAEKGKMPFMETL